MFTGIKYALLNLDNVGGSDGGNGAPSTDQPAVSVAEALSDSSVGKGEGAKSPESSLLASAQSTAEGANSGQEGLSFPEKYAVKNEDGTVNVSESTRKLLDGYNNLAKKMGETGGVVPDSAEGYKLDFNPNELGLPENITPEVLKNDADFKQFAEEAHKAGFTNEQVNLVATKYLNVVQSVLDRRDENDMAACKEALLQTWKTPAELDVGIKNAYKAFNHFASDEDKALLDTIGNNPLIVRVLANVGAMMREDSPVRNAQPTESRETITALMKSEAYLDSKHPEHEKVSNQVSQYYRQTVGDD